MKGFLDKAISGEGGVREFICVFFIEIILAGILFGPTIRLATHYPHHIYLVNLTPEQGQFICCNNSPLSELTGYAETATDEDHEIARASFNGNTYTLVEYTHRTLDCDDLDRWLDSHGIEHVKSIKLPPCPGINCSECGK